ncbi:MAG: hypothetical protein ABJF10_26535 [Chthoniobacter sp.]|uniref:hypothetical protein n=1 Tax=Chthoniobacter sp. TaxID=2510640 RepID=UPI0032AD51B2
MPPSGANASPRFRSSIVGLQEYAERCGLAEPSALTYAERLHLAYGIEPATAQAPLCLLCHGSGFQARGMVSGMIYEIACDCDRGRRESRLCTLGNPRRRNRRRDRRLCAYLGGALRKTRLVPIEEVWAGMEC